MDFHNNTDTMATIHSHVTQLYTLVTLPYVESAYSLNENIFLVPKGMKYMRFGSPVCYVMYSHHSVVYMHMVCVFLYIFAEIVGQVIYILFCM